MTHLPISYFERVYRESDDPWGFDTCWYEQRKYRLSMAALPKPRYARVFEPGCAIGVLSELLARRCDELIACEILERIAERARERLRPYRHARVLTAALPAGWPSGTFDLVVMSEVLYYLTDAGLRAVLDKIAESAEPGAHLLAVHYRGETDYPQTAEQVHAGLRALPGFRSYARYEEAGFLLDVLERGEADGSHRDRDPSP